eukprot:6212667-Pleurochrysis_carterae.AAC.3
MDTIVCTFSSSDELTRLTAFVLASIDAVMAFFSARMAFFAFLGELSLLSYDGLLYFLGEPSLLFLDGLLCFPRRAFFAFLRWPSLLS